MWTGLVSRLLLAIPFAAAAGILFACGGPGAAERRVLALAFIILDGIIIGPGIAALIAEPTGSLFYPRRTALPQPRRSIAESKRVRGDYRASLIAYEEVLAEFPTDLESWTAMVEIACVHLRDRDLADILARRALTALSAERDRYDLIRAHRRARKRADVAVTL